MEQLSKKDLICISGGSSGFGSTMLNAIARTVSTVFSVGQAVGSAIRRIWTKNYC